MNSRRDEIESWLDADVEPLAPPPGTFERVRGQARRRKAGRAIMSAAAAAVIVAGLAASPRIAGALLHHPGRPALGGLSEGRTTAPAAPRPRRSGGTGRTAVQTATPVPSPIASLSAAPTGVPVPGSFQPTSVTFVGTHTGAVIGQAGTPGKCRPPVAADCTSLAGTSDYGRTWYGIGAPVTGAPHGSAGVSALRFLDLRHGWAFGPQLWVTHDGGAHWTRESTYGLRVTDLETAGNRAFALFARCTGGGTQFAARCSSVRLFSSAVTSGSWQPVPGAAGGRTPAPGPAGQLAPGGLVLAAGPATNPAAGFGYLLAPSGAVLSGRLTGGSWTVAGQAPCRSTVAPRSGQPASAVLAAGSGELFVACTTPASPASTTYVKTVWASADGKNWRQAGHVDGPGVATSLAAAPGGLVVLATTTCIDVSTNSGTSWRQAYASPPGAAAARPGFSYVGMTDQRQGVAVPADPGLHEIFVSTDGGSTWRPSVIRG